MRVPDQVLKSAVFLGLDQETGLQYGGTGYIVSVDYGRGYTISSQDKGITSVSRYPLMFLVTAAHVAEKLEGFDFYIRSNYRDGTLAEVKQDCSTRWWYHPEERTAVDAALMHLPFNAVRELDILPIPVNIFASYEPGRYQNLGVGDEAFVAGLFKNVQGFKKNIPVIRIGNVAMMPDEKILYSDKRMIYANLLECRSTGGLSGSPVFVRETVQTRWGFSSTGSVERFSSGEFCFFGSMIGQWRVPVAFGTIQEELVNMGIAPIVPEHKILEIIRQPELVKAMEEAYEKIGEKAKREEGQAELDAAFDKPDAEPFTQQVFESALIKASRKLGSK